MGCCGKIVYILKAYFLSSSSRQKTDRLLNTCHYATNQVLPNQIGCHFAGPGNIVDRVAIRRPPVNSEHRFGSMHLNLKARVAGAGVVLSGSYSYSSVKYVIFTGT